MFWSSYLDVSISLLLDNNACFHLLYNLQRTNWAYFREIDRGLDQNKPPGEQSEIREYLKRGNKIPQNKGSVNNLS